MTLADCLTIVFISLCTALLSEGLSWLLIYRTEDYKRKKEMIDKVQQRVTKWKEDAVGIADRKKVDKKLAMDEKELKRLTQELQASRMKSGIFLSITFIVIYNIASSMFDGIPVAKLPFTPFGLLHGISHRNLPGTDFTDCSMAFLYALCSLGIRSNVQKLLGTTPPKSMPSLFEPPADNKWQ